jgi:signal transduction histidine kinase
VRRVTLRARRPAVAVLVAAAFLALPALSHGAPANKNVLVLVSESPETPGTVMVIRQAVDTVRAASPGPVNISVESLERSRFLGDDQRLVALYKDRYAAARPDLVIALYGPALEFLRRHRDELFGDVPTLFGYVDETMVEAEPAGAVSGVLVKPDWEGLVDVALRLHPRTRRLVVVGGTSEFDRGWQASFRRAAARFESRVKVEYLTDLALRDLLGELATLPDNSLVFFVSLTRDRTGSVYLPRDVLDLMRRVSPVPIYGPTVTYLGHGIVGGPLIDLEAHGRALGEMAVRVLAGADPRKIRPVITPSRVVFDWRELDRFAIAEAALPGGASILYRQGGFWAVHYWWIVAFAGGMGAQTILIVALVVQRRRRAGLERSLDMRLQFGTLLADLSAALSAVPVASLDAAIRSGLARTRQYLGVDEVSLLEASGEGLFSPSQDVPPGGIPVTDAARALVGMPYVALRLASFQPVVIGAPDELPADAAAERAAMQAAGIRWLALIPLEVGGRKLGVLACVSRTANASWTPERLQQLQTLAEVLANAVERRQAAVAVSESDRLKGAILSSMPAHITVLDRAGLIIAVNDAWLTFGRDNGVRDEASISPGGNYLEVCRRAAASGAPGAAEVLDGVQRVCDGRSARFEREYRCDSPDAERWFAMKVVPLRRAEGGAVVTHREVTAEKRDETALRELSGQLITAQEDERRRIARELHDDLQQRLALLAIELDALSLGRPAPGGEDEAGRARRLWKQTNEIATEVHRLSHRLHPSKLEALGLRRTIESYCRELAQHGLRVSFAHEGVPSSISPDVALCLFRIVQESLHNVEKHSGATDAQVTLSGDRGILRVAIADAGCGFDAAAALAAGGLGLVSMRERMHLVGGELRVESAPGDGTRIEARAPIGRASGAAPPDGSAAGDLMPSI